MTQVWLGLPIFPEKLEIWIFNMHLSHDLKYWFSVSVSHSVVPDSLCTMLLKWKISLAFHNGNFLFFKAVLAAFD